MKSENLQIEALATKVRNAVEFTKAPYDPELAIKKLGGDIVRSSDFFEGIEASVTKTSNDSFVIRVNPEKGENRVRFSLAHELGHLFMHMGYMFDHNKWNETKEYKREYFRNKAKRNNEETEANKFAAAFLMPADEFRKQAEKNRNKNRYYIDEIASYFKVSSEAVSWRGKSLELFE